MLVSRPDVATAVWDDLEARFPAARIAYDLVDFHAVRLGREAELTDDAAVRRRADEYETIERRLFERADVVVAVSEEEAAAVHEMVFPGQQPMAVGPLPTTLKFDGAFHPDCTDDKDTLKLSLRDVDGVEVGSVTTTFFCEDC